MVYQRVNWDAQPPDKVIHLVNLLQSSPEFKEILTHFQTSFRKGKIPTVTKIQIIQNPGLFGPYFAKKKSMKEKRNEMRLFHGTNVTNIPAINGNNFNRSFAGINGTRYGHGVYFTNYSSYLFASVWVRMAGCQNYSKYPCNTTCTASKFDKMYPCGLLNSNMQIKLCLQ